jgi:hypothetical protein
VHADKALAAAAADTEFVFPGTGKTGHLVEWGRAVVELRTLAGLPAWIVYDLRRTYLTCAEGLGLPPYALKSLVNHKQPTSDVTGGYLTLTPERLREPAQQVEERLPRLAKARCGGKQESRTRGDVSGVANGPLLDQRWGAR